MQQNGTYYCGVNMTQADVLADEFSSEILTLQDELITLRSQRDALIDAANSIEVGPNGETAVDWYVMEQFKTPWKFKESFLEENKCLLITVLLIILKQVFNAIGKAIMKASEAAATAAATAGAGPAGALVAYAAAYKAAFCAGFFSGNPGQSFYDSWLVYGIRNRLQKTYEYFADKDQDVKIWKTLTGAYLAEFYGRASSPRSPRMYSTALLTFHSAILHMISFFFVAHRHFLRNDNIS